MQHATLAPMQPQPVNWMYGVHLSGLTPLYGSRKEWSRNKEFECFLAMFREREWSGYKTRSKFKSWPEEIPAWAAIRVPGQVLKVC